MSVLNVQEKVKEMLLPKCGGTHVHVCGCFVGKPLYGYWPIQSNKRLWAASTGQKLGSDDSGRCTKHNLAFGPQPVA